jgi:C1A family cysteine protease
MFARFHLSLCLVAVASVASALHQSDDESFVRFQQFMVKFNKTYENQEEMSYRLSVFRQSLARAESMNAQENDEEVFGVTKFSDLTPEEFKKMYLGYRRGNSTLALPVEEADEASFSVTSLDWREKNAVTAVKDQQQCGSCWAFSTTESIESAQFMAGNKLPVLSPQQIVSCDTTDLGCNGGDTPTAYAYVEKAGGLTTAKNYPYTSGTGNNGKCKKSKIKQPLAKISGFSYATKPCTQGTCKKQNEDAMAAAMVTKGPASICVNAGSWQDYTGGILKGKCSGDSMDLDHCVQAVGFNKQAKQPYWIVRNSWNTDWGIKGYIYVKYGSNSCGVADEATFAKAA